MKNRKLYVGKQDEDFDEEKLWVWIEDRIPPIPDGLMCENERCPGRKGDDDVHIDGPFPATSWWVQIKDGHACWSYICEHCSETGDEEYFVDNEYPTTEDGYALAPKHCV